MRYWVGITDRDWFETLRRLQPDEVNFWQPSERLREEFEHGRAYYALAGKALANLTGRLASQPGREFLE